MKICDKRQLIWALILLFLLIPAKGKDTINCGRTFDKIQRPFSFGEYYGSESGNIWAAGGGGEIDILSSDKDIQILKLETDADFNAIFFVDNQFGFVLGTNGKIFNTQDGGETWVEQIANTKKELFAISCIDRNNCWVVGKKRVVLSTNNGGINWDYYELEKGKDLFAVNFITAKIGWIAGEGGLIMKTTDGGKTWCELNTAKLSSKKPSNVTNTEWSSIKFYNENSGCISGDNKIVCTSNGGKNWSETVIDNSKEIFDFIGFSLFNGKPIALEKCGRDFVSNDFGRSWVRNK